MYLGRKAKIGTKSGQFPQMSRIRDSVPKIGTTKGPAMKVIYEIIGPSGVRALPLAAGINVGGHYKWHFFLSLSSLSPLSSSLLILLEGVIVGF
jgi:hypothetical protein